MSKLKHTPGPWEYDDEPTHMRIHSKFDYDIICHMVGNSASSMIQKREIKNANAHLIAAAPEMLEALISDLKNDLAEWLYIGGKIEQFKKDNPGKVHLIERATGLSIEEVLSE